MKYLLLFTFSVLVFSSCDRNDFAFKKLECPAYNPTFLNTWFPYEEGNTYYYKDSTGDEHRLDIKSVDYYNGDEQVGCELPSECYPAGSIFALRDTEQDDKIFMNVSHSYNEMRGEELSIMWNSIHMYLVVNDDGSLGLNPTFYGRPEEYYQKTKPNLVHYENIVLNEVSYSDVYELTLNENELGNAHKVYLAKQYGIVGYETKQGRTYWMQ